jgi:uncharacterized membrane protein
MTQLPPHPEQAARGAGLVARLRNWFLTGIVITGPLAVTAYIVWWFIDTVDGGVRKILPEAYWPDSYLPFKLPGLGVIIAVIGLTLLGFLAANLAGRTLLKIGERLLDGMPVVRGIYKSVKQIFETVFSQGGTSFRRVGLVQFPAKDMWSLVFISTPAGETIGKNLPGADEYVSVFLPCTPNPTTGFFFYLPAKEVIEIAMTPDEAAKLIMSAGLIQPETQAKLAAAAAEAQKA